MLEQRVFDDPFVEGHLDKIGWGRKSRYTRRGTSGFATKYQPNLEDLLQLQQQANNYSMGGHPDSPSTETEDQFPAGVDMSIDHMAQAIRKSEGFESAADAAED